MQTPLISVIIPVYNVRPYLEKCLTSLQGQSYPKLEFILIDDGSNDGSGVFCDEFAKKDSRFKVIHQENHGLSAARNRGIKESKGEYITFVDSDDYVAGDYVSYLFDLINKNQTAMSICSLRELTLKNSLINYGANYTSKVMSTEDALGRMLRDEGFTVVAYGKLYHRSLWNDVAFPEGHIHEDIATTYQLIEKCPRIAYGHAAKYTYRKRKKSISNAGFSDQKLDIITFTDTMCDKIQSQYPYLLNSVNLRRMQARFAVLTQLVLAKQLSPSQKAVKKKIINYLIVNKKYIFKNTHASFRDKVAMFSLLLGEPIFKLLWWTHSFLRQIIPIKTIY